MRPIFTTSVNQTTFPPPPQKKENTMEESTRAPPPSSQPSSSHHLPIEPLPASRLLDQDLARKEALAGKGCLLTGCGELDDYVLLGGFERGSVVGVSAEEEDVAMLVSFVFCFLMFRCLWFVVVGGRYVGVMWVGRFGGGGTS